MTAKIVGLSFALLLLLNLGGCSSREKTITEGKVKYIRYQLANEDIRYISADKSANEEAKGSATVERYDSDPYVRIWPGYVEISYTSRVEGKEPERITHLIPRERLFNLRWVDPRG